MSSHSLRRTFGTNLLRHGVNLVVIKNLMGHESLEVTRKYLNVLDDETQQMYLKDMGSAYQA
jgi:site-specific recombinase XerD